MIGLLIKSFPAFAPRFTLAVLVGLACSCRPAFATVHYVSVNSPGPSSPYLSWATAATVIQDAIDVSSDGDEIVVTNGTYATGGRAVTGATLTNRAAVDRAVILRSVNGPAVTTIQGVQSASAPVRCAYLTNGAGLSGFTLQSGGTRSTGDWFQDQSGGGAMCSSASAVITNCVFASNRARKEGGGTFSGTLNNCTLNGNSALEGGGTSSAILKKCTLSGNSATWGGGAQYGALTECVISGNSANDPGGTRLGEGGGVYSGQLTNCTLANNYSRVSGGGASWGTLVGCVVAGNSALQGGGTASDLLVNCTIAGNSAFMDGQPGGGVGGGVLGGTILNSIVVSNTAFFGGNNWYDTIFSNSCTTPLPAGDGNITDDPAFVDYAGGNYRLHSISPCINSGTNAPVATSVDLDGLPRIVDGTVDMGAYEFQHLPFILVSPVSQNALVFSNVSFSVFAIGDEPLSYQWQKDGTNVADGARITGAMGTLLTLSNLLVSDAAGYRVVVTNISGSVTSSVATLTLLGFPVISVQPVSRTVPAGTNVSFSVTASGLAALSYQWRFNESGLVAKTNSSFSLTNVQSVNAGDYDVVITNIYGSVTSSVATLTVSAAAPTITTQAVSRVVSVGQAVSFIVAAKGSEPMTCQWQFNGVDLPGANGFTLTLANVNASFIGTYRAAVSNSTGYAFSTNVTLVVSPVLMWGLTNLQQLSGGSFVIPASATNVIAIAAAPQVDSGLPCMALRADGALVQWGYNPRDPLPPTNAVDLVAISVGTSSGSANNLVLRADGTAVSWSGSGKPPQFPNLTNQNIVAVAAGGAHQLALRDNGTVFAWGLNTSGQTNVPANATNVIAIAAGTSHSLALRADGAVVGWGLNTSGQATALNNESNIVAIAAGGNQSIGLRADGTVVGLIVTNTPGAAVSYGPPTGNTSNKISIAAGQYHSLALGIDRTVNGWGATNYGQTIPPVYATNVVAIAAGGNDSLALVSDPFAPPIPPRIGRPPLGRALNLGDSAIFNALAVGGLPMHFQWLRNGTPVGGNTNQWLALPNAHPNDAGDYQLVAMNNFGAVTSAVATVTVNLPAPILTTAVVEGNTFHFSFTTVDGAQYVAEYTDQLAPPDWHELETLLGTGGSLTFSNSPATTSGRFFRLRVK